MDTLSLKKYTFNTYLKVFPTEGELTYEYNPFRNYRLELDMIYYQNRLWTYLEFCKEILKIENLGEKKSWKEIISDLGSEWPKDKIPPTETPPVVYLAGQLVDFETDELDFDLHHPVNITPQWSYDNSVNLIINDGKNPPRIINSRFSITEKNKYLICDRKGNNDTNIYDLGFQFDIDTSLYRKTVTIPLLSFLGVRYGGNLSVGNYHFYFRYVDDDGNETDFFAESGLVSVFIGSSPDSIRSGFRDENSRKMVKFFVSNTDPGYLKIAVYYTKSTSDIFENATVSARKIEHSFLINLSSNTLITVTGFEETTEVPLSDINPTYLIYGSVETLDIVLNRLFLANVDKPEIPYNDLADCALRFTPILKTENYNSGIDINYIGRSTNNYYDPSFIYNKVGYWDDEIYRFGIVFILSDNTLTPVFNVRGIEGLVANSDPYTSFNNKERDFIDSKGVRKYISYNEETFEIAQNKEQSSKVDRDTLLPSTESEKYLENTKGVVSLDEPDSNKILGINFKVPNYVLDYLKNVLKIRGYFFVRQKRIPTTLCLAYTIAIDNLSNTPILPVDGNIKGYNSSNKVENNSKYITESFLSQIKVNETVLKTLTHNFEERILSLLELEIRKLAAICPDYDVNSSYLNSLFTGETFPVRACTNSKRLLTTDNKRHFQVVQTWKKQKNYRIAKIIGIEDNTKLAAIGNNMFSARAGEAEEAFRYEYAGRLNKTTDCTNLLRGSYGPFLGITEFEEDGLLIDIKIPGYSKSNLSDYFKIRYSDKSSYYAISDRFDLEKLNDWYDQDTQELRRHLYRGDCYICLFTHRINRNFLDPSAPINDNIVDEKCWRDNFEVSDGVVKKENFEKINLGDVNAVGLGMWVTLVIRSSMNLNIRALDESLSDEVALIGHPRGFYPYLPITINGSYKTPEALCYNKGFEKSVSERWNYEIPDVPWIKDEFSNRIAYSDIQVVDAFRNGFRVFKGSNYRDYPKTYGSITKIIELRGNLLCVFEHGVGLIPINERAVAGEGAGGPIYINTSNVLPLNPKIISDTFGSQWRDSIIKTPRGVYGVDTVGKKIWRTNGEEFECISDFRIQEFLNQNISLTERELEPVIGVRNVKTHYNKFKGDVMFTFYDNLYGFEEKVWNICFNEGLQKWITFYSWVPSYSENIYNQYFSFDRNTSKWITKLGVSKKGNDFSDGIVLTENIIPNGLKGSLEKLPSGSKEGDYTEYKIPNPNFDKEKEESDSNPKELSRYGAKIGDLDLANRTLPSGDGINITKEYELVPDNFGNWNNFKIENNSLYLKTDAVNLCSEFFVRGTKSGSSYTLKITDPKKQKTEWINNCVLNSNYVICKDERGRRINLPVEPNDKRVNGTSPVILLNIRANIKVEYSGNISSLGEAYATGFTNKTVVDAGYYLSVVAVIPKYNMLFLTTDFWKHGQAGIIDIADKIYPTYWYGKQHPFEFEFVVADNPLVHKIFDDLEIISNKAEPESFHYEIVGECYDFSKDKKNMYIRQEATKELYQNNGFDVLYNHDYTNLESEHRLLLDDDKQPVGDLYDKSTLFPLYYSRRDSFNEIEDFYHLKDNIPTKNFSALSGAEIVRYENLDEYRIWNHAKAIDLHNSSRLRGNMQYKEDKWNVLINPLNLVEKNEEEWKDLDGNKTSKIPVELGLSPIPNEVLTNADGTAKTDLVIPDSFKATPTLEGRGYVVWKWEESKMREVKLKDKFMKVRIRYSGKNLAIISAIRTLYSASYS